MKSLFEAIGALGDILRADGSNPVKLMTTLSYVETCLQDLKNESRGNFDHEEIDTALRKIAILRTRALPQNDTYTMGILFFTLGAILATASR